MIHTFFDMSRCIKCGRKTEYLLTCELCQTIEKRRQDDLDRRAKERREDEHRDMEARKEAAKNAQLIADSLKSALEAQHAANRRFRSDEDDKDDNDNSPELYECPECRDDVLVLDSSRCRSCGAKIGASYWEPIVRRREQEREAIRAASQARAKIKAREEEVKARQEKKESLYFKLYLYGSIPGAALGILIMHRVTTASLAWFCGLAVFLAFLPGNIVVVGTALWVAFLIALAAIGAYLALWLLKVIIVYFSEHLY